jgi:hypothetical protein
VAFGLPSRYLRFNCPACHCPADVLGDTSHGFTPHLVQPATKAAGGPHRARSRPTAKDTGVGSPWPVAMSCNGPQPNPALLPSHTRNQERAGNRRRKPPAGPWQEQSQNESRFSTAPCRNIFEVRAWPAAWSSWTWRLGPRFCRPIHR